MNDHIIYQKAVSAAIWFKLQDRNTRETWRNGFEVSLLIWDDARQLFADLKANLALASEESESSVTPMRGIDKSFSMSNRDY